MPDTEPAVRGVLSSERATPWVVGRRSSLETPSKSRNIGAALGVIDGEYDVVEDAAEGTVQGFGEEL